MFTIEQHNGPNAVTFRIIHRLFVGGARRQVAERILLLQEAQDPLAVQLAKLQMLGELIGEVQEFIEAVTPELFNDPAVEVPEPTPGRTHNLHPLDREVAADLGILNATIPLLRNEREGIWVDTNTYQTPRYPTEAYTTAVAVAVNQLREMFVDTEQENAISDQAVFLDGEYNHDEQDHGDEEAYTEGEDYVTRMYANEPDDDDNEEDEGPFLYDGTQAER